MSSLPSAQLRTGAGAHNHRAESLREKVTPTTRFERPRRMSPCFRRDDTVGVGHV